jgi:glucokinase
MPTESSKQSVTYWRDRINATVTAVTNTLGKPSDIGIASPGLAAADGRSIAWMQGRMEAVQGLDWTAELRRTEIVPVMNDAHAALLGEAWCGAAAGVRNAAMLTLGTGVGGACLVDGNILRGSIGRAGHLGHICLDPDGPKDIVNTPGSLEDAIGECTLIERSGGRYTSTEQLLAACTSGDEFAIEVWNRSLHLLVCGMVSIINITDPEVFIIGGGIAKAGPQLFKPLEALMNSYEWRPTGTKVRIVPAALGEFAGAIGAARNSLVGSEERGVRSEG